MKYPERDPCFAHRFVRILHKSCASQDIGRDACWLLTVIAHTEDAARYSGPVRFWNSQLMETLAYKSQKQFRRIREVAIDHGWLAYHRDDNRSVGQYFVKIPKRFQELSDAPLEAANTFSQEQIQERNAGENTFLQEHNEPSNTFLEEPNEGHNQGHNEGHTSNPIPFPSPKDLKHSRKTEKQNEKNNKPTRSRSSQFDPLKVEIPSKLDLPEFQQAWADWCQHRSELGKKLTPTSVTRQLNKLVDLGPQSAVEAINYSIEKGWTGIFPRKSESRKSNGRNQSAESDDTYSTIKWLN